MVIWNRLFHLVYIEKMLTNRGNTWLKKNYSAWPNQQRSHLHCRSLWPILICCLYQIFFLTIRLHVLSVVTHMRFMCLHTCISPYLLHVSFVAVIYCLPRVARFSQQDPPNFYSILVAVYHQQSHDTIRITIRDCPEFQNSCLLSTAYYRTSANYWQSRQLTSALRRASITVPQYSIGNVMCFMFTLCTPHQVKYSDCLHLVFKPINNNVLVLINLYCTVLINIFKKIILTLLVGYHCTN